MCISIANRLILIKALSALTPFKLKNCAETLLAQFCRPTRRLCPSPLSTDLSAAPPRPLKPARFRVNKPPAMLCLPPRHTRQRHRIRVLRGLFTRAAIGARRYRLAKKLFSLADRRRNAIADTRKRVSDSPHTTRPMQRKQHVRSAALRCASRATKRADYLQSSSSTPRRSDGTRDTLEWERASEENCWGE